MALPNLTSLVSSDKVTTLSSGIRLPSIRTAKTSAFSPSQAMEPSRFAYRGACEFGTNLVWDAVKEKCVTNPCERSSVYDLNNNLCHSVELVCGPNSFWDPDNGGCRPLNCPDGWKAEQGECFKLQPNNVCPIGTHKSGGEITSPCVPDTLQCPKGFVNVGDVCRQDPNYLQCPAGFKNVDNVCQPDSPCKAGETFGYAETGAFAGKNICCGADVYTKGDAACYDPTVSSSSSDKTKTYLMVGAGVVAVAAIAYLVMKKKG